MQSKKLLELLVGTDIRLLTARDKQKLHNKDQWTLTQTTFAMIS